MSAVQAVVAVLRASSEVTDIVGNRINFTDSAQTEGYPDIAIFESGGTEYYTLAGAAEFPEARLQVHSRALTYTETVTLAAAVIRTLRNARGNFGGVADVSIFQVTSGTDDFSPFEGGGSGGVHRRIVDFNVRYRAA